jgi:hypothetical protein
MFLFTAAAFFAIGYWDLANEVGAYGFYLLIAGILLQLISFLKHREKSELK